MASQSSGGPLVHRDVRSWCHRVDTFDCIVMMVSQREPVFLNGIPVPLHSLHMCQQENSKVSPPFSWVDSWFILTLGVEHLSRTLFVLCSVCRVALPRSCGRKHVPKTSKSSGTKPWTCILWYDWGQPLALSHGSFSFLFVQAEQAASNRLTETRKYISYITARLVNDVRVEAVFFANDWIKFHQVWPQPARQIEAKGREASSELSAIPRNTSDDND